MDGIAQRLVERLFKVEEAEFWLKTRQALLAMIDAIERKLKIAPTTAQMRRDHKDAKRTKVPFE